jgi:hypothetical protein
MKGVGRAAGKIANVRRVVFRKISLLSLTQQHNLSRENMSLLLFRSKAIIWSIKINKNRFLKEKRNSLKKLSFNKFKLTREFHKKKKTKLTTGLKGK